MWISVSLTLKKILLKVAAFRRPQKAIMIGPTAAVETEAVKAALTFRPVG